MTALLRYLTFLFCMAVAVAFVSVAVRFAYPSEWARVIGVAVAAAGVLYVFRSEAP